MGFGLVQIGTLSYRLTSRILLPFLGSGCSTSRREYQLHRENKYLRIEYLYLFLRHTRENNRCAFE